MIDSVLKDAINVELEVHTDPTVLIIVVDHLMNVSLLKPLVLYLQVVNDYLEEVSLQ